MCVCGVLKAALRVGSVGCDGCRVGATGATAGERVERRERRGAMGRDGGTQVGVKGWIEKRVCEWM